MSSLLNYIQQILHKYFKGHYSIYPNSLNALIGTSPLNYSKSKKTFSQLLAQNCIGLCNFFIILQKKIICKSIIGFTQI